ncbi:hypothetical protein EON64_07890 [archaeon]|nr:MAG: hypothetical protein EON64_07890 [archaeon]
MPAPSCQSTGCERTRSISTLSVNIAASRWKRNQANRLRPLRDELSLPDKKPSPYLPGNPLSHPSLHSTKVCCMYMLHDVTTVNLIQPHGVYCLKAVEGELGLLRRQAAGEDQDSDSDDLSVPTTVSDVRYALRNTPLGVADQRYDVLPTAHFPDEEDLRLLMRDGKLRAGKGERVGRVRVGAKGVRGERARGSSTQTEDMKALTGLSKEELAVFFVPPPNVSLVLREELITSTDTAPSSRHRYNSLFSLHSQINKVSQLPSYSYELNMSDVFGDINRREYLEAIQRQVHSTGDRYMQQRAHQLMPDVWDDLAVL